MKKEDMDGERVKEVQQSLIDEKNVVNCPFCWDAYKNILTEYTVRDFSGGLTESFRKLTGSNSIGIRSHEEITDNEFKFLSLLKTLNLKEVPFTLEVNTTDYSNEFYTSGHGREAFICKNDPSKGGGWALRYRVTKMREHAKRMKYVSFNEALGGMIKFVLGEDIYEEKAENELKKLRYENECLVRLLKDNGIEVLK